MFGLNYDLHIHSCLSPCGDDDMTPVNIVGMAALKELDVIALTDHNSCKNCEAAMKVGEAYGLIVIPGMELTTLEEVHVVCLFGSLEDAMAFDAYIYTQLQGIENNELIFGNQLIMDAKERVIGKEPLLLTNATNISFDEVYDVVERHHGIMIPAHLDKQANSLISNLGFIPPDSSFRCAEVHDLKKLHALQAKNPYLHKCRIITNSDAHYLEDIHEPDHTLFVTEKNPFAVLEALNTVD